jgi:hypothetical protein
MMGMRIGRSTLIAAAGLFFASPAFAQATGNSIGERLVAILNENAAPLFVLIAAICWCLGLYLFGSALLKLSKAGESGSMMGDKHSLGEALLRMFIAVCIFAMPDAAGIGMASMTGGAVNIFGSASDLAQVSQSLDLENGSGSGSIGTSQSRFTSAFSGAGTPTAPTDCLAAASTEGVTCMAGNIAKNAVPIGIYTVFFFAFLGGVAMFASGLGQLASARFGHGQAIPPGWWVKITTSLLLINSPWLIFMFATTIQGQGGVLTLQGFTNSSNFLSYQFTATQSTGTSSFAANLQQFQQLIGYCLSILAFFGVWAFFRGVFMAKAAAEGKQQGTYGHAMVFIVAGVLLANAKMSTCSILYTFGGMGMTFGFCN